MVLNYFKAENLGILKVIHEQTRHLCLECGNADPYQDGQGGCLRAQKSLVELQSPPQPVEAQDKLCSWCKVCMSTSVCECVCVVFGFGFVHVPNHHLETPLFSSLHFLKANTWLYF